ncbi:unnamed protein product [Gordionus sp. m RMFG-2023]
MNLENENDGKVLSGSTSGWNDPPFLTYTSNYSLMSYKNTQRTLNERLVHPEVSLINTTRNQSINTPNPITSHVINNTETDYEDTMINKAFIFDNIRNCLKKIDSQQDYVSQ